VSFTSSSLFAVLVFDIDRAHRATWYHPGQPGTRPTPTQWSARRNL